MKKIIFVFILFTGVSAFAYRAGSVSRPQFSTAPAAPAAEGQDKTKDEKSNVPGQQGVQTRSFTSYGARAGNAWRQGVQTQTVQTQTAAQAGSAVQVPSEQQVKDKVVPGKQSAETQKPTDKAAPKAGKEAPAPKTPEAAAPQQPQAGSDPAAMMQQLQGLQGMMGALGGTPGGKGGSAPAGMPDMSALMNMTGQGKPGKK